MTATVTWIDAHRVASVAPNERYPRGIDLDVTAGRPGCKVNLPYPARGCGYYVIECPKCGVVVVTSTAGRTDDPRSIKLPCKGKGE